MEDIDVHKYKVLFCYIEASRILRGSSCPITETGLYHMPREQRRHANRLAKAAAVEGL
jgi:hypothetical protein